MEYEVISQYKVENCSVTVKRRVLPEVERKQENQIIAKQLKNIIRDHKRRIDAQPNT